MKHTFIVNTENVNEYGYRILTSGIDINQYQRNPVVLYGHNRALVDPTGVIGRAELGKEDNVLYADVEFDVESDFAKEVAGKVERGFIRMCSLYAEILETSSAAEHILPSQYLETVTRCKLVELSIVDVGGNDNALKLSRNGAPAQLQKINQEHKGKKMDKKMIALSLGLPEDSSESQITVKIASLQKEKNDANQRAEKAENRLKEIQDTEAGELIGEAIKLGLVPESLKSIQLNALKSDYKNQKEAYQKVIAEKKAELQLNKKQEVVSTIVLGCDKNKLKSSSDDDCYDYLQKHNPAELARIHKEEPERYAQLAKEYGEGKRYIKN